MRKVEFTEAEAAAVSIAISKEIQHVERFRDHARRRIRLSHRAKVTAEADDVGSYDYWTNQLRLLRHAKFALEREEE